MKLRIPSSLHAKAEARALLLGMPVAEIVRRALRHFEANGCIELAEWRETATRKDAPPYDIEMDPGLHAGLVGWQICAVVKWALDATEPNEAPLELEARR